MGINFILDIDNLESFIEPPQETLSKDIDKLLDHITATFT